MNITSSQVKLFGFSYKYVWEAFALKYAETAHEITRAASELFLDVEVIHGKVRRTANEILEAAEIDAQSFDQTCIRRRKLAADSARKQGARKRPYVSDDPDPLNPSYAEIIEKLEEDLAEARREIACLKWAAERNVCAICRGACPPDPARRKGEESGGNLR